MSASVLLLFMTIVVSPTAAAESVPFDICAESTTWTRPSPQMQQTKIWNDPRYKDFARTTYAWTHDFLQLTNGFSKKFENHVWMVALYTVFYNFVKIHKTLRITPAMQAGLVDCMFTFEEIAAMIEANAPKPGPRGPYKARPNAA